jgi:glycosyltransferase involved in cell wall biosynthesis
MRILHVLTYYWPHWTGLTKYAQRLAEGHAARGHVVSVLTSQHDPDLPLQEFHAGVSIHRLRPLGRVSRGVITPGFPLAARSLIARHDVVQVHIPMLETWIVAALARRAGKPCVVTDHGDLVMPAGMFNQGVQRVVTDLMTQGLRDASAVTTHSLDYAQNSRFLHPFLHKLRAVYPPVEIPAPDPAGERAFRDRFGFGDRPVVGFAGRFVEEKGFDYLLRAVPLVAERIPEVVFAFAGERFVVYEDFYRRWEHLFESHGDRVVPVGLLTNPQELADFYGMCNAFAIPSRTDCFPSVQVEVMMCGTPVVTSNIPGARVAVQVTGAGRLVEAGNPASLADGLVEALTNPAPYVRPREEIEKQLGVAQSLDGYEELFSSLVDGERCASS